VLLGSWFFAREFLYPSASSLDVGNSSMLCIGNFMLSIVITLLLKSKNLAQLWFWYPKADFAKFFLSDNGSTSVEVAMKIAVQYWKNQGIDKHIFATFDGDYHGDTIGVMSVGKSSGYFDAYSTMCMETNILPYPHTHINDDNIQQKEAEALAVIEKFFANNAHKIAAFLIEPIVQGASGMRIVRFEFLNKVIALAKNYSILVIFDEVMTGFGRTGKMFAYNHLQHVPDIICLSKCVTGGFFPLGVTACKQHIYDQFFSDDRSKTLIHGHSYTANPIICAAAAANLQIFKDEETLDKISQISQIYADWLISDSCPSGAIHKRFLGNIIAFDVSDDIVAKVASAFKANEDGYIEKSVSKNLSDFAKNMKHKMTEVGIYARPIGNTVYCVPPYCIDSKVLRNALDKIGYILK
jgi:adenosylmethionine-8-amino-7-oxononanoate aminotransferase